MLSYLVCQTGVVFECLLRGNSFIYSVEGQAVLFIVFSHNSTFGSLTWPALGHHGQEGVHERLEASSSLRK